MPPRLILHADDFGLTPGINRAIIELHQAGVLTSASLMATGPAFEDAVSLARANPALGVGCHLVFVDGIPISHPWDIPTLLGADGKTFRPETFDFAQAAIRSTIRQHDLAREAQAQIQRLQRAGIDVTHVDTHKHTHIFPAIARTVLHIAQRCGVPAMRNPFEPRWTEALDLEVPRLRRMQIRLLRRFEPAFRRLAAEPAQHGFLTSGTLGIASTGTLTTPHLRTLLECALTQRDDDVYELCTHPGHQDAALDAQSTRLRASREAEYLALLEVVPEILRTQTSPALIHYGNLGVPGLQRASGQFAPHTGYEKVT